MASSDLLRINCVHISVLLVQRCHSFGILPSQKRGTLGCHCVQEMREACNLGDCQRRVWSSSRLGYLHFALPCRLRVTAWTAEEDRSVHCIFSRASVGFIHLGRSKNTCSYQSER